MYCLYNEHYDSSIVPIVSSDENTLEEILLSIYEEDAYEWYFIFTNSEDSWYCRTSYLEEAYRRALIYTNDFVIEKVNYIE